MVEISMAEFLVIVIVVPMMFYFVGIVVGTVNPISKRWL